LSVGSAAEVTALAIEIERRFLVAGREWERHVRWRAFLRQGYLATGHDDGLVVRVRTSCPLGGEGPVKPSAWLTLKAPAATASPGGLARLEFEYPIPLEDGEALLDLTPHQVVKRRHGLVLPGGGDWVLDEFEGRNAPLLVAEVELTDERQPLAPPAWCVRELTGRHELSNAALALRPLQEWSEAERATLWPGEP
jgi:CYTH domain-containing protein